MPNGRDHLKYPDHFGKHDYGYHNGGIQVGIQSCRHGCGCWMGSTTSGSNTTGVDPFGLCPAHILMSLDRFEKLYFGKPLSQDQIMEDFVNGRIGHLKNQIYDLEKYKPLVEKARKSSKIDLRNRLEATEMDLSTLRNKYQRLLDKLEKLYKEFE